jgi:hypothetical protein
MNDKLIIKGIDKIFEISNWSMMMEETEEFYYIKYDKYVNGSIIIEYSLDRRKTIYDSKEVYNTNSYSFGGYDIEVLDGYRLKNKTYGREIVVFEDEIRDINKFLSLLMELGIN